MDLTDEKKGIMFRMLAEKPLYETGVSFGLDKHYTSVQTVKAKMQRIYQEVKKDPERYFVSQDLCDTVSSIVSNRNPQGKGLNTRGAVPTLREKTEVKAAEENDITGLVLTGRAKAFKLLHAKLDRVGRNKKALDEVQLGTLATVAGILFDKGQIMQGQATENVAVMAKIDNNLSPEDALSLVLKMREVNIIQKDKDKK